MRPASRPQYPVRKLRVAFPLIQCPPPFPRRKRRFTPAPRRCCAAIVVISRVYSERRDFLLVTWNRLPTTKLPDISVRTSLITRNPPPLSVRPFRLVMRRLQLSVETPELTKSADAPAANCPDGSPSRSRRSAAKEASTHGHRQLWTQLSRNQDCEEADFWRSLMSRMNAVSNRSSSFHPEKSGM